MTPTVYVENWAPYRYLIDAMLRVKPMPELAVRAYCELDHPVVREPGMQSTFVAYQDEMDVATFSFLSVAEALDRKFADVKLCGDTPITRALIRSACQIIDEGHLMLAASQMDAFDRYDGPIWHPSSQAPDAMLETYFKKMIVMERLAGNDGYLLGAHPTLADVIVAACSWYAEDIGLSPIPEEHGKLNAWYQRHCADGVFGRR